MSRWIFVRHGESTANAGGFLAGWDDVPLTPRGEAQARAAGEALAGAAVGRVLTSDLRRALDTTRLLAAARVAAGGAPLPEPVVDSGLRERRLGAWSGAILAELRADGRNRALLGWETSPPGGESHDALARRSLTALAAHGEGPDTLLVGHGGLIRVLLGLLDGEARVAIGRNRIANAEPLRREIPDGTWARLLDSLGETPSASPPC